VCIQSLTLSGIQSSLHYCSNTTHFIAFEANYLLFLFQIVFILLCKICLEESEKARNGLSYLLKTNDYFLCHRLLLRISTLYLKGHLFVSYFSQKNN
jgi:hypothetical protein